MHTASVRIHWSALMVELTRAGMVDAREALWDWANEYLDIDEDQRTELEEDLDLGEDPPLS